MHLQLPVDDTDAGLFQLIREGKLREAQMLMDEFTPFRMSVCGTVCPAPCMQSCSRAMVDGPLEIQKLAREFYPDFNPLQAKARRRESVAVIGAGPAGLSAAWQLARRGYAVSVFDAADDLGGKLRKAIPRERLSDEHARKRRTSHQVAAHKVSSQEAVDAAAFAKIRRHTIWCSRPPAPTCRKRYPSPARADTFGV